MNKTLLNIQFQKKILSTSRLPRLAINSLVPVELPDPKAKAITPTPPSSPEDTLASDNLPLCVLGTSLFPKKTTDYSHFRDPQTPFLDSPSTSSSSSSPLSQRSKQTASLDRDTVLLGTKIFPLDFSDRPKRRSDTPIIATTKHTLGDNPRLVQSPGFRDLSLFVIESDDEGFELSSSDEGGPSDIRESHGLDTAKHTLGDNPRLVRSPGFRDLSLFVIESDDEGFELSSSDEGGPSDIRESHGLDTAKHTPGDNPSLVRSQGFRRLPSFDIESYNEGSELSSSDESLLLDIRERHGLDTTEHTPGFRRLSSCVTESDDECSEYYSSDKSSPIDIREPHGLTRAKTYNRLPAYLSGADTNELYMQPSLSEYASSIEDNLSLTCSSPRSELVSPRKLNFGDFHFLPLEGIEGHQSTIFLAKRYNVALAIKRTEIAVLQKKRQINFAINEKTILSTTDNPFIVQFHGSFRDKRFLYLAMKFVDGVELFNLIQNSSRIPEKTAQLITAEVLLALEDLHLRHIAYRDIKPENIIIDRDGHIKVVDLGFAKDISSTETGQTYTVCGTPEYIAPEIILQKGHTVAADYWSLGILLFEMLSGEPPFQGENESENHMEIYEKALALDFEFPEYFSPESKDLISRLLTVKPQDRIGNSVQGIQEIKRHPFFRDVDWEGLFNKQLGPAVPARLHTACQKISGLKRGKAPQHCGTPVYDFEDPFRDF
jgi:hypothetical protein